MIDLYITHFVTRSTIEINDLLVDQLFWMQDTTPSDLARTRVVVWTDDVGCVDDIRKRVPRGVDVFINDRPGRPDAQPSMRNKAIDLARSSGCEAFVLLHNDVRPVRGWLPLLIDDWRWAEDRWGKDSSVISPRLIPYHLKPPHAESGVRGDTDLWTKRLPDGRDVMTTNQIEEWCGKHSSEDARFKHGDVRCPKKSRVKYDGRELMMFMASPRFFDAVGGCDETMTGTNFDDTDWAIRAYEAGKRNLQSHGSLIGHIGAFTLNVFAPSSPDRPRADNSQLFIAKWGRAIWDEMHAGDLWRRLQKDQRKDGE